MKKLIALIALLLIASPAFAADGIDGRKVVAVAGTAENVVSSSARYNVLFVCSETDNTGIIAVGTSPVATVGSQEGILLKAGACMASDNDSNKLSLLKIDASVSGEGVSYYYE